jgi:hypothetical protein
VQPLTVDPDNDRDQGFERTDVAIVVAVKTEMVVEPIEGEGRFGGRTSGQRALFLSRRFVA